MRIWTLLLAPLLTFSVGHVVDRKVIFHYDLNGKLSEEVEIVGGKADQNGFHKIYGTDGHLREVRNYKNGFLDGLFEDYYSGGRLRLREYYNAGKRDGESVRYHPDGYLLERHIYENDVALLSEKHWETN